MKPTSQIQFPYGIADFQRIRRQGMLYIDRTSQIRNLESLGSILVFLRPRRFGKSLLLQTLASYYDLRLAEDFDALFGGLEIGRQPTPERNLYFILQWNFSAVAPGGSVEQVRQNLEEHVVAQAQVFASDYVGHLPIPIRTEGNPAVVLTSLLGAVRKTPHKLYLLIDEYDNFINEIMAQDSVLYQALVEQGGPFKQLFKSVKMASEGQGLERVFVTGVSPVALNDITSGFNTSEDVTHEEELAALCGFREPEVREVLARVLQQLDRPDSEIEPHLDILRLWYNGYRFAEGGSELVYNPTNALYFLKRLARHGQPPRDLHDQNLRTDRGKVSFIARTSAGSGVIEGLTQGDGTVEVNRLQKSFSLEELAQRIRKDPDTVASFLYYMGILTRSRTEPRRLQIPNLVVKKLLLDRLLEIFLPDFEESHTARRLAARFFRDGELAPLLAFFEHRLLPVLSNRDRGAPAQEPWQSGGGVNEMVIKTLFLSILFDDQRYQIFSELEAERGYADLCLLVRPELRTPEANDLLFEFKLVRRKNLGKKGQVLRDLDTTALRRLPLVEAAFHDAGAQLRRYRKAFRKRFGEAFELRTYAVVAVDLERILGEEVRG